MKRMSYKEAYDVLTNEVHLLRMAKQCDEVPSHLAGDEVFEALGLAIRALDSMSRRGEKVDAILY